MPRSLDRHLSQRQRQQRLIRQSLPRIYRQYAGESSTISIGSKYHSFLIYPPNSIDNCQRIYRQNFQFHYNRYLNLYLQQAYQKQRQNIQLDKKYNRKYLQQAQNKPIILVQQEQKSIQPQPSQDNQKKEKERQQQNDKKNDQIQRESKDVKQIQTQTQALQQKIKLVEVSANRFQKFFCGDVLFDEQDYKQYLTELCQELSGRTIKNTKLLYRYDPLNSTNIHKYIDDHEYFVLVAKLTNQYLLAFFSEGSLSEKKMDKKDAWIISLTNRRYYKVLDDRNALSYDKTYLIVGNNDIRVSSANNKLFSNFGISNSYFESNQDSVHSLLGKGEEKQVQFEFLEVFKLVLH